MREPIVGIDIGGGGGSVAPWIVDVVRGGVPGYSSIIKHGEAPMGMQTTATDVWSRADATPTQPVWLAPTAARTHAIVSSSTDDDGSPVGAGARTLQLWGLKTWSTEETSEVVTLNGTTPVNTANAYVIVNRMKVVTSGATSINVGTITATAAAPDSTVTAVILPGDGQTKMAIHGVPSTQDALVTRWSVAIHRASGLAATVDFSLRVNENPDVQTTNYLRRDDMSVQSTGTSSAERRYDIPNRFAGPCIIKVTGIASAADTDADAGFSMILATKE